MDRENIAAPFLIVFLTFLVFAYSLGFDFVWEDISVHLHQNRHLDNFGFDSLKNIWTKFYAGLFIPVSYTLWGGIKLFSQLVLIGSKTGLNSAFFHFFNLLFHILNGLLIFYFLKKHITQKTLMAMFAALLFLLHPMQVQSVCWVSEFKGALAVFFSLLSIISFLNFSKLQKGVMWYLLAFLCFVLAVLSKPTVIVLPFIIIVFEVFKNKCEIAKATRWMSPFIALSVPIIIITHTFQQVPTSVLSPTIWQRLTLFSFSYLFYLVKLLIPAGLSAHYGFTPQVIWAETVNAYLPVLVLLTAGALFMLYRRSQLDIMMCLVIFLISILPTSGLVTFGFMKYSTVADHYLYFPLLAISILVAVLLDKFENVDNSVNLKVAMSTLLLIYGVSSFVRSGVWSDSTALWTDTVLKNPNSDMAYQARGMIYKKQKQFDKAIQDFKQVIRIKPDQLVAALGIAESYNLWGKYDQAEKIYQQILKFRPNVKNLLARADNNVKRGAFELALKDVKRVLRLKPNNAAAKALRTQCFIALGKSEPQEVTKKANKLTQARDYFVNGNSQFKSKNYKEAINSYLASLRLNPKNMATYHNLGSSYIKNKDYKMAVMIFDKLLTMSPNNKMGFYSRGVSHFFLGNLAKSKQDFKAAERLGKEVDSFMKRVMQ
ncbi:MAG: tetratricopeptide repeat protein [Bacteriovoracaceae bacterium]|nr:tetratricopeptide repeat protein [Bacteriovoracaceae bacterium]